MKVEHMVLACVERAIDLVITIGVADDCQLDRVLAQAQQPITERAGGIISCWTWGSC